MSDLAAPATRLDTPESLRPRVPDSGLAAAWAFLALAGPMIVSRLGLAAMSITDGVMLAHHDTRQFALHGLADAVVGRAFDVAVVFMIAGLALAAQARAGHAGQRRTVGRVWRQALWLASAAGLAGLLLGVAGTTVLSLAGQDPALAQGAGRVVYVLCLGMLPALWAMATAGILEALGRPIVVAAMVVVGNVLNIAFNAWLIDGVGNGPPLGAVGVAWSTTLVRYLLAAALVAVLWWMPGHEEFGLRRRTTSHDWRRGQEQRARGWSAAGTVAVLALLSLGLPMMAGWLGETAVATLTAMFLALAPCMVIAWGVSDAAGLRVATLLGGPDALAGARALRITGPRLTGLALALLLPLAVVYLLWPRAVVGLGVPDPVLVHRVALLMPWGVAVMLLEAVTFVYASMLRSLGELRWPFVVQAVSALVALPLSWLLGFKLHGGLAGIVAGHALGAAMRALCLAVLYDRAAVSRRLQVRRDAVRMALKAR